MAFAAAAGALASDDTERRLEAHVAKLTQPELEGRRVGTEGHDKARDYIVSQMQQIGLEPAGESEWFTSTTVVWSAKTARSTELRAGKLLARGVDYRPLGFSDDVTVEAPAFFAGYGLSDPRAGWDDYAGVDVTGAVVVVLTGGPAGQDTERSSDDSKAATALAKGAAGILFVNDPRTHGDRPEQRPDELGEIRPSEPLSGMSAGKLTRRSGSAWFEELGYDLEDLQESLDQDGPEPFALETSVSMTLAVERERASADNVVGMLPGTGPAVVLGAHYDHLGHGIAGSLWDGEPAVHPGADDNASGIAVILESARRLKNGGNRRPIYFVATTGEELGLRGARRVARSMESSGATYINLDMVGRLREPGLRVLGLDRIPGHRGAIAGAARTAGVTIVDGDIHESSSDHIAFFEAGFRAIHVTTGRHPDYHRPTDTPDRLNPDGMKRVTTFVTEVIRELAQ